MIGFIQNLSVMELVPLVVLMAIIVLPFWRIFKRIGWPPALSLFVMIPGVMIIVLYIIAFGSWKDDRY